MPVIGFPVLGPEIFPTQPATYAGGYEEIQLKISAPRSPGQIVKLAVLIKSYRKWKIFNENVERTVLRICFLSKRFVTSLPLDLVLVYHVYPPPYKFVRAI